MLELDDVSASNPPFPQVGLSTGNSLDAHPRSLVDLFQYFEAHSKLFYFFCPPLPYQNAL